MDVDPLAGQAVERPVIGLRGHPPRAGFAEVGQPGAELVAQQPEQAEDQVAVPGCSTHFPPSARLAQTVANTLQYHELAASQARSFEGRGGWDASGSHSPLAARPSAPF